MEIIRNYLETMFQNLPNTKEVQKAKFELGQMMEDKYTELREEGKTDNEAIGIVISEFGNLDELAEDLGIEKFIQPETTVQVNNLSMSQVRDYVKDKARFGVHIGLGVLMCIISPCGVIVQDSVPGLVFLFVMIGIAVGLFVFSGMTMGKWKSVEKNGYGIDFATAEYVHNERENYRTTSALLNTIGVVLCVLSVVPLIIMDEQGVGEVWENIGVVILLAIVSIGVFLFIVAAQKNEAYDTLLKLNGTGTVGANYVDSQNEQVHYDNKTVAAVMSVYWPTVTCIYLCWSFLTFNWHVTWIVWVIASIMESFIKNVCKKEN